MSLDSPFRHKINDQKGGLNETTKNVVHGFGRIFACFISSSSGSRRF
jgi:hypothetical protein